MPPRRSSTRAVPMRRQPQQARAEQRVLALVDAAEALIADGGLAAATTNAIAAQAGCSVGSLYQFFPNGDAVIRALAARYTTSFDALKDRIFGPAADGRGLRETTRSVVDAIGGFCDAHPAYPHIYRFHMDDGRDAGGALHEAAIDQVAAMFGRRYPSRTRAECARMAFVQVHAVHAVVMATMSLAPTARRGPRELLAQMLADALAGWEADA